ncbi:protein of unknown function [Candidatus Filomicrobium marinum]|uniref:Uncharacterized protein n=1 Tax=Candidatus Filomicrobium marinum TaxID=1608628 RepID=A0A0D6J969_9HYPH|nr:protein of unknown function [Candidatus Filomicrobium marinum]CPR14643.1 protein of unknown function [Candidatus Filomicrobium marinum]
MDLKSDNAALLSEEIVVIFPGSWNDELFLARANQINLLPGVIRSVP